MESCVPVNTFFRYYLLRGVIGSKKSWASTGRALYDFFSFLLAHELDWRNVDRGEAKSLVAAYRDYCLVERKAVTIDYPSTAALCVQVLRICTEARMGEQAAVWLRGTVG
jgi:hypothetical protein